MSDPPGEPPSEGEGGLDRTEPDTGTAMWLFLFVGFAIGTMSLVYLLTDDDAGQMMLGVASILALVCGTYLWFRRGGDHPVSAGADPAQYLPHSSIWPFWIGVAAFLLTNGLILGTWFLVPGAVVLVAGVVGWTRQTRARS